MRKAFIQLHIAVFLAGFTGVLGRLISLNEGWLVWYRLLITAISMWVLFLLQKKIQRITINDLLKIFFVGLIAMLHWITFFGSIKYSNISVALVCFSSIGFFTAFTEPLINRKRIDMIELLLGLIVMAGIYIIFHFDPKYKTGIIIGIISALLASIFPVYNRKLVQRINAETLMSYEITSGFIFLSALMPLYIRLVPSSNIFPAFEDWIWLLILSWLCSVWAFILSANALKRISAFTVNLSFNLEPVYGILLAFVIYKENKYLHPSFYTGLIVIFISVLLQTWRVYRMHKN